MLISIHVVVVRVLQTRTGTLHSESGPPCALGKRGALSEEMLISAVEGQHAEEREDYL